MQGRARLLKSGAPELTIRLPLRWVSLVVVVLWFFVVVLILTDARFPDGLLAADVGILALGGLSAVLNLRAGIFAGPDGVVGRATWGRTRRLAWADVHHFALRGGYWHGLGAWTMDGRWVSMLQYGLYDMRAYGWMVDLDNYRWECQQALGLVHVE